ncbi:Panacea domain-containing protein [Streptobacillus moniliformis]|uniref:Panacea domain-containing protein n=1 Tax=Streptobacillus moniliformis TaxID=34105 RepID=UPI0007E4635F|nr:type II toxin-antitoxin system antitoxin SocA domain-containing protein [Streptobacillus moniliformis]
MTTALNIANNFLELSFKENIPITPMKLQKLLYILYKEFLKKYREKLFTELFEAWQYGPVLPNVYSEFKNYRANPIKDYSLNSDGSITKVAYDPLSDFNYMITDVWNKYKGYSGIQLSEFTHGEDTAWKKSIENQTYLLNDKDIYEEKSYV